MSEYVGGPILVALGMQLDADQGRISRDDLRVEMTLTEAYAAIADVMDYATDEDFGQVMDELSEAVAFWVDRWLESYVGEENVQIEMTAKLSASLIVGAAAFWEQHSG